MPRRDRRFTVYDAMEAAGAFDGNTANRASPQFEEKGGASQAIVQYPKMFYHPKGEERVTNPGEIIVTPLGPKLVGQQKELIYTAANNKAEADALRKQGWHDHPAKAVAAGGGVAPPISADQKIKDLEEQIAIMKAQANDVRAQQVAEDQAALTKGRKETKDFMAGANAE